MIDENAGGGATTVKAGYDRLGLEGLGWILPWVDAGQLDSWPAPQSCSRVQLCSHVTPVLRCGSYPMKQQNKSVHGVPAAHYKGLHGRVGLVSFS